MRIKEIVMLEEVIVETMIENDTKLDEATYRVLGAIAASVESQCDKENTNIFDPKVFIEHIERDFIKRSLGREED